MVWTYIKAVFRHWATAMTGTAGLIVAVVAAIRNSNTLFIALTAACGLLLLVIAGYRAWKEQYDENEVGRIVGSLSLVSVQTDIGMTMPPNVVNAQVVLNLKNKQPRLVEYRVEAWEVSLESRTATPNFMNMGCYVYANETAFFRDSAIVGIPFKQFMSGVVKYAISYNTVGSKIRHVSRKKLRIDVAINVQANPPTSTTKHTTLEEHED